MNFNQKNSSEIILLNETKDPFTENYLLPKRGNKRKIIEF